MKSTPKPLTLGDISRYCHVDRVTVQRWVKNSLMPAYRTPGGHYRVSKENFRRFLRKNDMPIYPQFFQEVPHRIVLADAPEEEAQALARQLEEAEDQYEVKVCSSGREALIVLGQFQPDLVILDPHLEGLGGPSVCAEIKKMSPSIHLRILALLREEEGPEEALANGADQCIRVPSEAGQFLNTVQQLMGVTQEEM